MISVQNLTKHYGDVVAVNNISFTVRRGEITGLLGPNGAGKTTTMRMLTCFLKPTSGVITVGDFRADENPLGVRDIVGYLPESVPLYNDMLVYDYLRYVAKVRGVESEARIGEIARLCGIAEVMHKPVGEISKGYRQRVGLAHAMIHDPEILILDEPTSGLDPNQIVEIRNLIREIGKTKTVILSTHILSEVEATCDRVIIISRGSIVTDSDVSALKSSYGSTTRVSVTIAGVDGASAKRVLEEIPGVTTVSVESVADGLVSLFVDSHESADARPEIFRRAVENSWIIYEMVRRTMTLESIFRELTTGGGNEIVQ